MAKYKVKENNEVQYGAKRDASRRLIEKAKVAKAGDVIELSKEEAEALSHAVEPHKDGGK